MDAALVRLDGQKGSDDSSAGSLGTAKTGASAFGSFTVKVTAYALNVREGPGTSYVKTDCIRDKGTYTIVGERDGWGRLKSGLGWISLAYTSRTGSAAAASPKKPVDEVAREVIAGRWGNGSARRDALRKAGYDYTAVQKCVNELLK